MGNKHVISDLYQMQSLPLNAKVRMTQWRIREWVDEYGEDGVYISFSGGKDSTVLLDIARKLYPNIKAMETMHRRIWLLKSVRNSSKPF